MPCVRAAPGNHSGGCAVTELVASDGAARNPVLMRMIAEELPAFRCAPATTWDCPPEPRALAFAVLGFLTAHGLPGTLPSAGARRAAVLGGITRGLSPPRLTEPAAQPPRLLRIVR
ncbi:anhydro-N-acetylmuramic acid kinase [Streptomyces griseoluteus]|uniref:anhydro-N-acetylmuramic acid kinase n=1 Tax=Streptomyces griseoluteus TaxID=29306 RepID=UPI003695AC2E